MSAYLFLNLLFLIHFFRDFYGFSELLCGLGFHIQSELRGDSEKCITLVDIFAARMYLFSQSGPPFDESLEVALS